MIGRGWLRRAVVRLAIAAIVLAALVPVTSSRAATHAGPRTYIDLAPASAALARHDHAKTICHSCAGHLCLEQHDVAADAQLPPALPAPDTIIAPPAGRVVTVAWPRAPDALPGTPPSPYRSTGPPQAA